MYVAHRVENNTNPALPLLCYRFGFAANNNVRSESQPEPRFCVTTASSYAHLLDDFRYLLLLDRVSAWHPPRLPHATRLETQNPAD